MFTFEKNISTFVFLCLLLFTFLTPKVFAAAGDSISGTATISYQLGGANKIGTATAVFTEDRKINFTVADSNGGAAVQVISDLVDAVMQFTVTNTSNSAHDFLLTAVNTTPNPFATPDENIDPLAGTIQVFVESGATPEYQAAEDVEIFIDELLLNETRVVYVLADIATVNEDDVAAIALIAQIAEGGTATVEGVAINADDNGRISPAGVFSNGATSVSAGTSVSNPGSSGTMETVFNDPAGLTPEDVNTDLVQDVAGNGQHSDAGAFQVIPPVKLTKTLTVIDTLGGSDPHQGATLHYEIEVALGGNSAVTNLVINDLIPENTIYTDGTMTLNGVAQTDADDAPVDFSKAIGIAAKPVTAIEVDLSEGGTVDVAPGDINVIVFEVTIK